MTNTMLVSCFLLQHIILKTFNQRIHKFRKLLQCIYIPQIAFVLIAQIGSTTYFPGIQLRNIHKIYILAILTYIVCVFNTSTW